MPTSTLANTRVLVTRPAHQARAFCEQIAQEGGEVIAFPSVEIQFLPLSSTQVVEAQRCDWLIFTSANAVAGFQASIGQGTQIAAIGKATAKALADRNWPVSLEPQAPYNSESLLVQLTPLHLKRQHIGIIKGAGGRALLKQQLSEEGAHCVDLCVYERKLPLYRPDHLDVLFSRGEPDIVSTTSNEGLGNLLQLVGTRRAKWLLDMPLVVNSQRGFDYARQLGFKQRIYVANPTGDQGQLQALRIWAQSETKKRNQ